MQSPESDAVLWFKRWGWCYRPIHPVGWIAVLAALVFVIHVFVVIDAHSHSVTDTLYRFYTCAVPTFLGLMWLASRTSDERGGTR